MFALGCLSAQELTTWDPWYGFPLLHNYTITMGSIVVHDQHFLMIPWSHTLQLEWFAGEELFQFITHIVRQTASPTCIFMQEYQQHGDGAGVWGPAIPNNTLLATLISLVSVSLSIQFATDISPR